MTDLAGKDGGSRTAVFDTIVWIEAPEQFRFQFQLAGPAARMVAYVLDLVVNGVLLVGLYFLISLTVAPFAAWIGAVRTAGLAQGLLLVTLFLVHWFYFVVCESLWNGRTPGKRALGLRVVRASGEPAGFAEILVRNLLRGADGLPVLYLVGATAALLDPHFRRLGDLAAGTLVVHEGRRRLADRVEIRAPGEGEQWCLRTRLRLGAEELRAVETLLQRRTSLGSARARELAAMIAGPLATRIGQDHADPLRLLELVYLASRPPEEVGRGMAGYRARSRERIVGGGNPS